MSMAIMGGGMIKYLYIMVIALVVNFQTFSQEKEEKKDNSSWITPLVVCGCGIICTAANDTLRESVQDVFCTSFSYSGEDCEGLTEKFAKNLTGAAYTACAAIVVTLGYKSYKYFFEEQNTTSSSGQQSRLGYTPSPGTPGYKAHQILRGIQIK